MWRSSRRCRLAVLSSCAAAAAAAADLSGDAAPRALSGQKAELLTVGASGDFMPNTEMMQMAFHRPDGYQSYFLGDLAGLMHAADLFVCNHETVAAECVDKDWNDLGHHCPKAVGNVYNFEGWSINNHPRLEADLKALGVDVVTLANNHIMDRGPLGVARTINALDAVGLPHTGARKQSDATPWEVYTERKGWRIAWIGCAEHLTDHRASHSDQILYCNDPGLPGLIAELSGKSTVDAVVIALHWGRQSHVDVYQTEVTDTMRTLARSFIDAGASAIVGAHPHVLMELEWHTPIGTDRKGLILYSLGNFVATQAYSEFCLKRCMEKYDKSHRQCKRTLLSKVVAYFQLEPHSSGKASVQKFSYMVVTWSDRKGGMVPVWEDLAKKSWAAEVLGEQYRIPGRDSKFYHVKENRYCSNDHGRKDLPDVSSVRQCRDQVLADKECGGLFTSNGKSCHCTMTGETCNAAFSLVGTSLYAMREVQPGGWERTSAHLLCGAAGRKHLGHVAGVHQCERLAEDDPDCGSELETDGEHCACMRFGGSCDAKQVSDGSAERKRGNAVYKWVESTQGLWLPVRKNMHCARPLDRQDLGDVSGLEECQARVVAEGSCGGTFISNGRQCTCMRKGKECHFEESSHGDVVYMWHTTAARQWRAVQGRAVLQADIYSTVERDSLEGPAPSGRALPPGPPRRPWPSSAALGLLLGGGVALQALVAVALRRRGWRWRAAAAAPPACEDGSDRELLAA